MVKTFEEVLTIVSGRNQKKVENPNGKYPIYGSGGIMGHADDYICEANTVIVGRKGSINNPIYVTEPFWNVDTAFGLVAKREVLHPKYLYYFCRYFNFEKLNTTVTIPSLTKSNLLKVKISIPAIYEQEEIVCILGELEEILDEMKLLLTECDVLIKSRFVEMFGSNKFPIVSVEEVCSNIVDCPHTTPKYEGVLTNPAIRTSEIKKGYIAWDTMKYVSDEEYIERTARLIPKSGDIVYGREGTFGNAAILPNGYKFCLGQRVMLLRPDYGICTSEYLLYAVISDDVYMQAREKNNASTVAHVNVKDVKQFMIPLPPIELQNDFVEFVTQVNKSKSVIQKSLDETQLLFDSLMQEYFG